MNNDVLDYEGLVVLVDEIKKYVNNVLPAPSSEHNGKILGVIDGKWTFVTVSSEGLTNVEEARF